MTLEYTPCLTECASQLRSLCTVAHYAMLMLKRVCVCLSQRSPPRVVDVTHPTLSLVTDTMVYG